MSELPTADLIVGPAIVITQDARRTILRDAYVASRAGRISYVGPASGLPSLAAGGEQIDASGQFIVPGFDPDTHTHLYQTLMKGLGDDMGLMEWLDRLTLPTIPHLTGNDTYLGAMIGLVEALHAGTTSVLDFFVATENHDLWDGIARGYHETGVRGFLGLGVADNLSRRTRQPLEEQLTDIRDFAAHADPLVTTMLGPGSCWAMTPSGFERLREEANRTGMGMTLHLNEAVYDCEENFKRYGEHTVPMLERLGFLGPDLVLAHCCYLTDEDIAILARTGAIVSTNPVSNMLLGNAFVRLNALLDAGVTVGIGPDGAASNNTQDMFEAIKMCALVQKGRWEDAGKVTAQTVLDLATIGGAKSLRLQDQLGSLEPGKLADFFLFDPRDARSGPWHEPVSAIVYSGGERNVTTTVVNGTVVMRNRIVLNVDELALVTEAQAAADALRDRADTSKLLAGRAWTNEEVLA